MEIKIRQPVSALTHFIAMLMTAGAGLPLLIKAAGFGPLYVVSMLIFLLSMIALYGASATYHAINLEPEGIKRFRKLDHSMIFVLIAGSYTPVCLLILNSTVGLSLLTAIWGLTILGIVLKVCWINCPKWLSSSIYIAMGWLCLFVFKPILHSLTPGGFLWLLTGGLIYTVGGVIYALKLPIFNLKHKYFGSHEIFHLFVMGGSFCHFIFMYQYVL
ncbi:MAG: hemolysin III family protein [Lachnospiraceae bacterium]|nr:hemolysin III family protein [Lachnospiraceae bacterium]